MPSDAEYTFDLKCRVCNCGNFQVTQLPCRHVLMHEIRRVYQHEFVSIGDPSTWPTDTRPQLIHNPVLRRGRKGRPKSTQYLNKMDARHMRGL
ncbi:hypothetical protein Ahy_A09g044462 isoform B [Arachis hypogaea]|uniref:SWIM-type domain-containing protein n=1 Tax=Arachis hypogaea TaxID=3818 RepID=A0A445BK41_ARAHY|nr:hypothetical protein Ahy_A09g044462 isoform B [Arachis hypogaea]